jgi:hypothetical protein
MSPRSRVLAAVGVAATMAVTLGACSSDSTSDDAAPTTTEVLVDSPATVALRTAATTTDAAPTYGYWATVVADGRTTTITGEVVAPDRVHESVLDPDGGLIETISIGSDVWVKEGQGPWTSGPGTTDPAPLPTSIFAKLSNATALNKSSEVVLFKLVGEDSFTGSHDGPTDVAGEATLSEGHITRLRYGTVGPDGSALITVDFSQIGDAAITIVPPAL